MRTFFATLLLIPAVLAAQAPPEPSGARLRLGTDTLVSFLVRNGDTTAVGWVIDEISARELNGERVLFRVYRGNSQLSGSLLDTLVDVLESLQPRSHSSRSSRSFERVQFSAGRAVGRILQPTGDSIMVDVALPSPVYSSASFDLVLRSSPLADGWTTSVPAFVTSSRVVVAMTARVAGIEQVDGEACWRVEAEFMGMPVAFWVSRETRRICKQEMRLQAGLSLLYVRPRVARERRAAM